MFRPLVHWVNTCVWCKVRPNLILSHVDIRFSQHYLLKTLPFPPLNGVGTFVENHDCACGGLFLSSLCCPIGLWVCLCVFMTGPNYFHYCSFVVSSDIRACESSNFILFQDYFGYLGSLERPCNFLQEARIFSLLTKTARFWWVQLIHRSPWVVLSS